MKKNIQTHNADYKLTQKFLDYANCADASYALLHFVNYVKKDSKDKYDNGDKQDLGSTYFNKDTNTEQISTYARAIEARFNQEKVGSLCIPLTNKCLIEKDKISNNDITQVKLNDTLSQRTITFTNRFKLLKHQKNTDSGFSATLFQDRESKEYTLAIRGTEFKLDQIQDLLNDYYIGTNNDRKTA